MVASYNTASQGSGNYAVEGDLFAASGTPAHLTTAEFSNFDVAVIALGFHHFEDPKLALSRLYERLKAITGVLVIVDFLPFSSGSTREGMGNTIKHHGFQPEELQKLFTETGFVDFDIAALKKPAIMQGRNGEMTERTIFIARGRKMGSVWERFSGWFGGVQDSIGGQLGELKKDGGGGWNPGLTTQEEVKEDGGMAWDMVGGRTKERGVGSVEREETRGWNGFR